jgi:hypothetical protein
MRDGAHLRGNAIYTRRGVATEEANHDELQRIISRRLETGYSSRRELDLRTHLEQLRVLYEQVSPYRTKFRGEFGNTWNRMVAQLTQTYTERLPNPNYPRENYETFVVRAIARKKWRIEMELDIEDIPASDMP